MVSRNLAHRSNAWLNRVEFFYTYSWQMGYVLAIFKCFLSALRSIKNYVNPFSLCIHPDFLTIRYYACVFVRPACIVGYKVRDHLTKIRNGPPHGLQGTLTKSNSPILTILGG